MAELIHRMPEPERLGSRLQALAMIDAIHGGSYPKYSFQAAWREGITVGGMDNGGGDEFTAVFAPAGVLLFGFDHESPISPWSNEDHDYWPGLTDGLPAELSGYLDDPAFITEAHADATFISWWTPACGAWACGQATMPAEDPQADGANWMLGLVLDFSILGLTDHVHNYWDNRAARAPAIQDILDGRPLTGDLIFGIKPDADVAAVRASAATIGYPCQGGSTD